MATTRRLGTSRKCDRSTAGSHSSTATASKATNDDADGGGWRVGAPTRLGRSQPARPEASNPSRNSASSRSSLRRPQRQPHGFLAGPLGTGAGPLALSGKVGDYETLPPVRRLRAMDSPAKPQPADTRAATTGRKTTQFFLQSLLPSMETRSGRTNASNGDYGGHARNGQAWIGRRESPAGPGDEPRVTRLPPGKRSSRSANRRATPPRCFAASSFENRGV